MRGKPPAKTVDDYLAGIPEPAQSTLRHIREVIRSVVPRDTTEVISYGMPMFKYKGLLVGFAAFPNHCGLYVTSPCVMQAFKSELKNFDTSKGAIRFPIDKPPPPSLIKKLVKARVAQSETKR